MAKAQKRLNPLDDLTPRFPETLIAAGRNRPEQLRELARKIKEEWILEHPAEPEVVEGLAL